MRDPRQIAALPVRREPDGRLSVMLITSRETRRWVIPKGWPMAKLADHVAAAIEAEQEAGIVGTIDANSVGCFEYEKRRPKGDIMVRVTVYRLDVTEELDQWPEADERRRAWFTVSAAADAVEEDGLKQLIAGLD